MPLPQAETIAGLETQLRNANVERREHFDELYAMRTRVAELEAANARLRDTLSRLGLRHGDL